MNRSWQILVGAALGGPGLRGVAKKESVKKSRHVLTHVTMSGAQGEDHRGVFALPGDFRADVRRRRNGQGAVVLKSSAQTFRNIPQNTQNTQELEEVGVTQAALAASTILSCSQLLLALCFFCAFGGEWNCLLRPVCEGGGTLRYLELRFPTVLQATAGLPACQPALPGT